MGQTQSPAYRDAVTVLLWQLADDDLLIAHRASEWLGLAPHIEEDVAFSSIAQDEMGHAATYFRMLAELGLGDADEIAHRRTVTERRNSVLVELPNGTGSYLHDPHFDWAFTIARHYFYDTFEMLRLRRLTHSAFAPLAAAAAKIVREEHYHRAHLETWMHRLAGHSEGSRAALARGMTQAAQAAGDLWFTAPWRERWDEFGIYPDCASVADEWRSILKTLLEPHGLAVPQTSVLRQGRLGEHTEHLDGAIQTLSAVYALDPAARW